MKKSNIKDAFGGEVAFTKYIATTPEVAARLLKAVDVGMEEGFTIVPENGTVDGKRVDLVVRDQDNEVVQVIESQDATGWLDSIHASKIAYYCYEKECMDGILLTEDADEHIKGFVRWYNENTPLNIYLVYTNIFITDQGPYVDFVSVMRPFSRKEKKVERTGYVYDADFTDFFNENLKKYPERFTNATRRYIDQKNVARTGWNVGILGRKNYWLVNLFHGNRGNQENIRAAFTELFSDMNPQFNSTSAYVNVGADWNTALEIFDKLVEAVKTDMVHIK